MKPIKQFNLLLSFLLELLLLYLVGFWGFRQGETLFSKYALAAILPVIIMLLWGVWAAPKSKRRLKNPLRTLLKLTLFLLGALLSYLAGRQAWTVIFLVSVFLNAGMAFLSGRIIDRKTLFLILASINFHSFIPRFFLFPETSK